MIDKETSLRARLESLGSVVVAYSGGVDSAYLAYVASQTLGDLAKLEDVEAAVSGCDVVFHVAAKAGVWGRYADFYDTNVTGTENVLAACKKNGGGSEDPPPFRRPKPLVTTAGGGAPRRCLRSRG